MVHYVQGYRVRMLIILVASLMVMGTVVAVAACMMAGRAGETVDRYVSYSDDDGE